MVSKTLSGMEKVLFVLGHPEDTSYLDQGYDYCTLSCGLLELIAQWCEIVENIQSDDIEDNERLEYLDDLYDECSNILSHSTHASHQLVEIARKVYSLKLKGCGTAIYINHVDVHYDQESPKVKPAYAVKPYDECKRLLPEFQEILCLYEIRFSESCLDGLEVLCAQDIMDDFVKDAEDLAEIDRARDERARVQAEETEGSDSGEQSESDTE